MKVKDHFKGVSSLILSFYTFVGSGIKLSWLGFCSKMFIIWNFLLAYQLPLENG